MSKPMLPKGTVYKMLGFKRHTKRSPYGHYIVDGRCIDCGITSRELADKFTRPSEVTK